MTDMRRGADTSVAETVRSFGLQWNRFRRTQLDRFNGTTISRDRLLDSSGWAPDLEGQTVLEAGSGAGRFTQVLLDLGARVLSFDLSAAVLANRANNGHDPRLLLAQADIYRIPARPASFDKVLCLGVLQHCPDVAGAFASLAGYVRPGGELVIDVYDIEDKNEASKPSYRLRRFSPRMPPRLLFALVRVSVPALLWARRLLQRYGHRIPFSRTLLAWNPVFDYKGVLPLDDRQLREWAVLDTFDFLAPCYDNPQHIDAVRGWFQAAGLELLHLRKGGNGIVGRGRRPAPASTTHGGA